MDYEEYNLILSRMVHTLIAMELLDRSNTRIHYRMHAALFKYWENKVDDKHEGIFDKGNNT